MGGVGPALVGEKVVARTMQGDAHDGGRVIAYCEAPSVVIEREDGSHFSWRADLCARVASDG